MKKLISNIVGTLAIIFIVWVLFSWLNIIANNTDANPMYAAWNFFTIFFR